MRDGLGRLQRLVVLGGTSDIGLAIAARLVHTRGVREVVLAGRDPRRLAAARDRLRASQPTRDAGPVITTLGLEATAPAAVVEADVAATLDRPTDVVVHAVGVLPHDDRDGDDVELAAEAFAVNTVGSAVMLLTAARHLQRQGHGTLVALSSIAAVRARPDNLVYGGSKAGFDALALGLADQLAGSGARVLVVRPGFVHSRMTASHAVAPMARHPEDVARAVDTALDRSARSWARRIVWVPPAMAGVAAGIRALPGPVLRRIADQVVGD